MNSISLWKTGSFGFLFFLFDINKKASKQQCLSGHKMVSQQYINLEIQVYAQLVHSSLICIQKLR